MAEVLDEGGGSLRPRCSAKACLVEAVTMVVCEGRVVKAVIEGSTVRRTASRQLSRSALSHPREESSHRIPDQRS